MYQAADQFGKRDIRFTRVAAIRGGIGAGRSASARPRWASWRLVDEARPPWFCRLVPYGRGQRDYLSAADTPHADLSGGGRADAAPVESPPERPAMAFRTPWRLRWPQPTLFRQILTTLSPPPVRFRTGAMRPIVSACTDPAGLGRDLPSRAFPRWTRRPGSRCGCK